MHGSRIESCHRLPCKPIDTFFGHRELKSHYQCSGQESLSTLFISIAIANEFLRLYANCSFPSRKWVPKDFVTSDNLERSSRKEKRVENHSSFVE